MSASGRTTKDTVHRVLVREIVEGVLRPGSPLSERALVERFGISRTPIRQVIWQLERDDLVTVHEHRGVFVKKMGADDILELFQLREALEPLAAMLAAAQRPDDAVAALMDRLHDAVGDPERSAGSLVELGQGLHDALVAWSGNRMLARIYATMRMQTQLMRILLRDASDSERASLREHVAILAAVQARDPARAHVAMADHLRRASRAVIDDLFAATPVQPFDSDASLVEKPGPWSTEVP